MHRIDPNKTINIVVGRDLYNTTVSLYKDKGIKTINWDNNKANSIIKQLSNYDCVIFHISDFSKISDNTISLITSKTPTIIFWYGSPFELRNKVDLYKDVKGFCCAYEYCQEGQQAVARYINKSINSYNEIPKNICDQRMYQVDSLANMGVINGAYPGCQMFFSCGDSILIEKSFGTKTNKRDSVSNQTIYDLASLTKALATTPALMLLVAEKKVDINDRVSKYLPEYSSSPIGNTSIKSLLFHESGLPSGLPFYEDLIDPQSFIYPLTSNVYVSGYVPVWKNAWANPNFTFLDKYISTEKKDDNYGRFSDKLWINSDFKRNINERIANTKLTNIGGYRYSDINFFLLQQIIEKVSEQPLDTFVENRIYKPLNCNLKFRPLEKGVSISDIAPSQIDKFLRKSEIRGTVDDELAACLGGVSGNAGIFGSIDDVAKVCRMLLNNGKSDDGETIISPKVVKMFTQTASKNDLRFLGFDKPSKKRSVVTAESAPFSTFGHTGFTGCCFWIDPENKSIFIFISNRTYPERNNAKLITDNYRTRLQQLCYDAIGK